MSLTDDLDFVSKLIHQSEKVLCAEMAKVRKSMKSQEEANKALEQRVTALEHENESLHREVSKLQHQLAECQQKYSHDDCSIKMQNAFSAALNSFPLPMEPPILRDYNLVSLPNITSTPTTVGTNPEPTGNEMYKASRLSFGKRKAAVNTVSTSQIYTSIDSLPDDLRKKLEPHVTESAFSTREMLNTIQRAFVKYKVAEIRATGQKIGDAYINNLIQEGIDNRIWTTDFKPSSEKTLAEYLAGRIKNERKAMQRKEMIGTTNSRLESYINAELSGVSNVSADMDIEN